ncbi:MAG: hypothetical protein H6733_15395 [Alphaproteobacteria bacterium]|nr:hypothetical protein [Alphaproteobacteria bacterium]
MRLLLSMGLKPGGDPAAPLQAVLRWLDPSTGTVVDALHVPPTPGTHPSARDHAECLGAHRDGDVLVQVTRTEVIWLDLPTLAVRDRFSHPLFHDLHDARPLPGGGLAVTSAGNDSVLVFDVHRELVAHHVLRDVPFAVAFPGIDDFRTVPFDATKPHHAHPNRIVVLGDDLWVTCLVTQTCRCLTSDHPPLAFPEGPPHDGVLLDGLVWFTTVTGHLIAVDPTTRDRVRTLDLGALTASRRMPGWCRGIAGHDGQLYVGMTMLRSPTHRELLRWVVKGEAGRKLPTRVLQVDPSRGRIVAEHPVGNAAGGTLYDLTVWAPPPARPVDA